MRPHRRLILRQRTASQKERIAKKAKQKADDKKAEAKKAAKEAKEERLNKSQPTDDAKAKDVEDDSDTVTITASSIEELMQKISDWNQMNRSDDVLTEEEQQVGQHIDYRF